MGIRQIIKNWKQKRDNKRNSKEFSKSLREEVRKNGWNSVITQLQWSKYKAEKEKRDQGIQNEPLNPAPTSKSRFSHAELEAKKEQVKERIRADRDKLLLEEWKQGKLNMKELPPELKEHLKKLITANEYKQKAR